ncbi:MAG: biotin--[acetyl-CoA-carboxylase] ligase [Acidimicrobiaceae bacterium]|nr:biotin--[acetyl-CoA-carboxylase] ligase [Acidimicrobiaceae bacterium]MDE0134233.1 biotin--[acetyl-CoA-carboxylase] ligase [Acidimicrobiaceae bacterium]
MPAEHEPGEFDSPHFGSVAGTRFGDVVWRDEIGSTNTELLDRARSGAPEGKVLIADLQTAGRGRRGRRWTAPPGTSLMMSVLLRPPPGPLPPTRAALVTLAVGLAAADACEQVCGIRPLLKWPNDLVIAGPAGPDADGHGAVRRDRKLAGILAESISTQGLLSAVVVGMGLNTGWPEVPAELEGVATSLNLESGAPVDRTLLARRVLEGLEARYELLCRAADGTGTAIVLDEARRNSATLGHRVRVSLDATTVASANDARSLEGLASDLDAEGRLLITDDVGTVHTVAVGDVVHLRPA